jgi:hypothetical protein
MVVRLNSSFDFLSLSGGIVEISHIDFLSFNFQRQLELELGEEI